MRLSQETLTRPPIPTISARLPYCRPFLYRSPPLLRQRPRHHSLAQDSSNLSLLDSTASKEIISRKPRFQSQPIKALPKTMQFLIRSGTTQVIHSNDAASIPSMISERTGIPESSLLLSHAGRTLDTSSFATLSDNSTIHASYRIPGGAIKKRCQQKECTAPALRGLDCSLCAGHFCSKHRLLEQHACSGLANCKEELRRANQAKLESERCVAPKVV